MPAPPPSHTGRTGFSVALWSLLSGVGLFYSLQEKTRWKAEATLSKWQSGVGVEEVGCFGHEAACECLRGAAEQRPTGHSAAAARR